MLFLFLLPHFQLFGQQHHHFEKNQYLKYHDIKFINPGGWHFSNIKSAEDIEYKLKSYLHHREFDVQPLSANEIKKIIEKKQALYDLRVDKRVNKIGNGSKLVKFDFEQLPIYIQENKNLFKQWLD